MPSPKQPVVDAEAELNAVVQTVGDMILAFDREGRFLKITTRRGTLGGYPAQALIGRSLADLLNPQQVELGLKLIRSTLESGKPVEIEFTPLPAGVGLTYLCKIIPLSEESVLCVARDVTVQRQTEMVSKIQQHVLELIASGADFELILMALVESVENARPGLMCTVLQLNPDTQQLYTVAAPSLPLAYSQMVDGMTIGPTAGSCGTAAYKRELVVVSDIEHDPLWNGYRDLALEHGLRACWSKPILSNEGEVLGVFAMYYREPTSPTPFELQFIESAAHLASIAIKRFQAETELRRAEEVERERAAELETIRQATLSLTRTLEFPDVLNNVLRVVSSLTPAILAAYIYLYDVEQDQISFGSMVRADGFISEPNVGVRLHGLTYTVARTGQVMAVSDMNNHPLYADVMHWGGAIVGFPLRINDRVVGVMNVTYSKPREFTTPELRRLMLLADQAAIAIENARLFNAEKSARVESEALHEVTSTLLAVSLDREQVLQLILDQLGRVVEFDSASIMLIQHDELTLAASRGLRSGAQTGMKAFQFQSMEHLKAVVTERRPIVISDTQDDPRWQQLDDANANYIRCWLGVPLIAKNAVLGVFNLDKEQPHYYTARHAQLVSAFANQAAIAIEHARLYSALAQEAQRLDQLNELGRDLAARLDPEQVYAAIHRAATQLMRLDTFIISLVSDSSREIRLVYLFDKGVRYPATSFPVNRGITGQVIASGKTVRIDNLAQFKTHQVVHYGDDDHAKSLLMTPMLLGKRVIGTISAQSYSEYIYTDVEERTLSTLAYQAAISIENARLYEETQSQLRDQTLLYECAHAFALVHDSAAVMTIVANYITARFGATSMTFYSYDDTTTVYRVDFEFWTGDATAGERRSVMGQTSDLTGFPMTLLALRTRTPQFMLQGDTGLTSQEQASLDSFEAKSLIIVPMVLHDRPVGMFEIWNSRSAYRYTEREQRLLMALSTQLTVAMENVQLYAATKRQSLELSTLLEAVRAVSTFQKLDDVINLLARQMTQTTHAAGSTISKWDRENDAIITWVAWRERGHRYSDAPGESYPLDRYPTTRVVLESRQPKLITITDTSAHPAELAVLEELRLTSMLMIPLIVGSEVIGLVEVFEDASVRRFAADEINLIQGMVDQASIAIANAQLFEAVAQEKQRLELLYDLSQSLSTTLNPQEVGDRALARMCPAFGAFQGAVYILDPRSNRLHLSSLAGADGDRIARIDRAMNMHVGEGLSGWVAQERTPLVVKDVSQEPRWVPIADLDEQVRSIILAPLVSGNQLVGLLNLASNQRGTFTAEQLPLMVAAAAPVAAALYNARLFEGERRHAEEMRHASSILHALNASPDITEAFPAVSLGLKSMTGSARVSIALLNHNATMVTIAALDQPRSELNRGAQFPISATAAADDVLAGRLHRTPDLSTETSFAAEGALYKAGHRSRVNVPLRVGQSVLGSVNLVWGYEDGFSDLNFDLMTQVADALALAIEKNRFFDDSRRRDAILESLAYGSQCLLMPGDLGENLMKALTHLGLVLGVSHIYVFENVHLPDGTPIADVRHIWIAPNTEGEPKTLEELRFPYAGALERWGQVLGSGRPLYGLIRDLPANERELMVHAGVKSLAAIPIFSGGEWWGFLGLGDNTQDRAWSVAEIEALRSAAATIGVAFARQQSENAEREQRSLAEALRDTASALNSTLKFDEVINRILENVGRVMPHDAADLLLLDEKTGLFKMVSHTGYGAASLSAFSLEQLPNLQTMAQTGQPLVLTNIADHSGLLPDRDWVNSHIGAPIIVRGRAIGFLSVESRTAEFFRPAQAGHLMAFANEAAIAIDNAQLFAVTERHVRSATLLNEITRTALEAANYPLGLQALARQLASLIEADGCYISLWDNDHQQPIPAAAYGAHEATYSTANLNIMDGESTFTGSVLKAGRTLISHELLNSPYLSPRIITDHHDHPPASAMCLPMIVGERKLGAVMLTFNVHYEFSDEDIALCEQATRQVALAIFKSQLIESEREQRELAEALRDTAGALSSTLNFDDVLERVLENVGRVVPHDSATIWLSDNPPQGIDPASGSVRVVGNRGYAERGLEAWISGLQIKVSDMPLMQAMIRTRQAIIVNDTRNEPGWRDMPEVRWIRALAGAPIGVRGSTIGFINLNSTVPGFFSVAHAERLQVFADQAAVAIENAFLYDSIRQHAEELTVLYQASARLMRPGDDVTAVASKIVSLLAAEFKIEQCSVYMMDETTNSLRLVGSTSPAQQAARQHMLLTTQAVATMAAQQAAVVYIPNLKQDVSFFDTSPESQSAMAAPLSVGGRVIGVIQLESHRVDAFNTRLQRMIIAFAERAGLALENTQLVTRLDLARRSAEEASKLKSEFLANTSHELRTPLTGIITSLSMVIDGLCDSREEEREFIEIAYSSSEQLHQIINSVLDIAKIEAGRMDVELATLDVVPLLTDVYNLTRLQAEEKGLRYDLLTEQGADAKILADPNKLRQIMLNLIGNAIKFTERGSVTIRTIVEAEHLKIQVQDTGIGVSPDKQTRLFEPFVQADGSMTRRYGGTGLGLSISRHLAEMMGGELSLVSQGDGLGTLLTLKLPLAR